MAVKIKWRQGCWRELRVMPEVLDELDRLARGIASRAGDGFIAQPAQVTGGRGRGRAAVVTGDLNAMRRQAKDHVIEAAL